MKDRPAMKGSRGDGTAGVRPSRRVRPRRWNRTCLAPAFLVRLVGATAAQGLCREAPMRHRHD